MTLAEELRDIVSRLEKFKKRLHNAAAKDAQGLDMVMANEFLSRAGSALNDLGRVIGGP